MHVYLKHGVSLGCVIGDGAMANDDQQVLRSTKQHLRSCLQPNSVEVLTRLSFLFLFVVLVMDLL